MRALETGGVHRALDGIGERLRAGLLAVGQRARVPESRQVDGKDVEVLLEQREHRVPGAPSVTDAVDQNERIARAAAMVIELDPRHAGHPMGPTLLPSRAACQ